MFQTNRDGNLTDDADRWTNGHEQTFDSDPAPDWEGMEYDDWHSDPKCGGCWRDDEGRAVSDGCRHCSPVDHECKPHGFGIERFEDPALELANAAMWAEVRKRPAGKYTSAWVETWGYTAGRGLHHTVGRATDADLEFREMCWRAWTTMSLRRERHSDIVWDRLCDECETHGEAVRRYKAWTMRAVTVRYRDESAPAARRTEQMAA